MLKFEIVVIKEKQRQFNNIDFMLDNILIIMNYTNPFYSDFQFVSKINEVIVYRVMMYANPLLIEQVMYFTSKGQSVYYSTRG